MMPPPSDARLDPEELLAQAGWLRRLALDLMPDAARADDLVQETLLAALKGPPRSARALRSWLARVVRNLAHQSRRSEAHRRAREEDAAALEALPSAEELAQEVEAQRRIAREVQQLCEPYRTVLLLRYWRDLAPAEIARRQGLPAGTVRSQLARGIALLRQRLVEDEDEDEGASLQGLLCLAAGLPPSTGVREASLLTLGSSLIVTMNVALKIGLAAGLVGLTYVGWIQLEAPLERSSGGLERPQTGAIAPLAEEETVLGQPEGEPRAPLRAAAPPPDVSARTKEEPPAASSEVELAPATLVAVFVDAGTLPQAGVALSLREGSWSGVRGAVVGSDSAGRAELEVALEHDRRQPYLAQWSSPLFASGVSEVHLGPGEKRSLGTIVLIAGAEIQGRVVDPDGAPVEGVRMWTDPSELIAGDGSQPSEEELEPWRLGVLQRHGGTDMNARPAWPSVAVGDANGAYALQGVPAAQPCRLWAWKPGWRYAWSDVIALEPGERRLGVDLVLEPLADVDCISGIVVGPDGAPLPEAEVRYQLQDRTFGLGASTSVDDQGRFEIIVWRSVPHHITASLRDGSLAAASLTDVPPGSRDLVLRLGDAEQGVRLRVRDEQGEPIERYSVMVHRETESGSFGTSTGTRSYPEGEMWLHAPAGTFRLAVEAEGYAVGKAGPYDGGVVQGGRIDITLLSLPGVSGVVVAGGEPIAGAQVALQELLEDSALLEVAGFRSRAMRTHSTVTSAEDGSFVLYPFESGEYLLRASHPDWGVAEIEPLWINIGEPNPDHRLVLPRTGALVVRVVRRDGGDTAGTIVGLNRDDGHPRTLVADERGEVQAMDLTPGGWAVTHAESEVVPNQMSTTWRSQEPRTPRWDFDCEVRSGETTVHELVLEPEPEGEDDAQTGSGG